MTEQISDVLHNERDDIHLDGYYLYGVCVQDPSTDRPWSPYSFTVEANQDKCEPDSSCWKGYISMYRLDSLGHLTLTKYVYLNTNDADEFEERLEGNFWMELRKGLCGDKLFIPFVDGIIENDNNKWLVKRLA